MIPAIGTALALSLAPGPSPEPIEALVSEAWRLWRAGRPGAAIDVAAAIVGLPAATPTQRCNAVSLQAFHELNLGRPCNAARLLAGSDADCAHAPVWLVEPRADARARAACAGLEVSRRKTAMSPADPLSAHQRLCEESGADACLVIHEGEVLSEWYATGRATPTVMMSSTKSVTALLVGMLIGDGKLASVDEPVCRYVESWCTGRRGKVTVAHLLSHTSGLERRHGKADSVGYRADKNAFVLGLSPDHDPGSRFDYSNEGVQLLSPLLAAAAGEPLQEYARKRLFEPLGMRDSALRLDAAGHAWTYADMTSTPRDFARLGQLVLDRGAWRGQRIVSAEWIERMLRPSQTMDPSCGYLWWLETEPRIWMTRGYLDTNMYVLPDSRLIVVRTQSRPRAGSASYEPSAFRLFRAIATGRG